MTRNEAALYARKRLDEFNLSQWSVRINPDERGPYGLCSYKDECIILNGLHIDTHPDAEVIDTINHEVAHALTPGHNHDMVWKDKAKELEASPFASCAMTLDPRVIDAIRSGATAEVDFEEVKVQRVERIIHEDTIRRPKYQITRLQDRCPTCNKVAVTKNEITLNEGDDKPDRKLTFLECGHVITHLLPKATPFHKLLADGDESCIHEWEKHPISGKELRAKGCIKCGGKSLLKFQIDGCLACERALASGTGFIIMDEMGLGKTPQSIGTLVFHPEEFPLLVIVKSKIKFQWFKQLMRWSRDKIIAQIINTSDDFLIPGMKAYIISFDMMVPKVKKVRGKTVTSGFDISKFDKVGIKTVIIDECQHISNPDSTRTQMVRRVAKGRKVIGLSGTPWKNRGSEFYSILNMVSPMLFPSHQGFKDKWVQTYWNGKYNKEGGIKNPNKFKELIKDIAIRREKKEVLDEYTPVNRMPLYVELSAFYQDMYDASEGDFVKWYNDKVIGGEPLDGIQILAQMTRMRHATGLAKIPAITEFVLDYVAEKEGNFIIGVHHKDVAEILMSKLREELPQEIRVLALKAGGDSTPIVEEFNRARSVLVASTLAGGEGVDGLQLSASALAMAERQWNPANEEQFEGRLDRMGQKDPVVDATYIMANETIDTFFDEIVERKRRYFHEAMNRGEAPSWNQGELATELANRIVANFNKKSKMKNVTVSV